MKGKKVIAKVLKKIAHKSSSCTSGVSVYEPKLPKALKKDK
ncbi:cyclic lactone autoinducer peptide [Natroniella sulfidigena]|nr:cyclic lactone autoinducer peptide [Natroniella sulfidigena]MCK8816654.1 cyclic lactone autoinducer peptide [Natroniella sulfidigena]